MKGSLSEILVAALLAFPGVILIGASLQGWIAGIGRIPPTVAGWLARAAIAVGGFLLAAPTPQLTGMPIGANLTVAAVLIALGLVLVWTANNLGRKAA
jgi:hypothetical protein